MIYLHTEDAVGEFTLQIIFMFLVFFIMSFSIFAIQHTQSIDFKTFVNGQVERHGGFTPEAVTNIQNHSEQYFSGRFTVKSLSGYDRKPHGEVISYKVQGRIQILFFNLPDQLTGTRGFTISRVR